jgi:hypothetical protein
VNNDQSQTRETYAPNMEKLRNELGRTPPPTKSTTPEDFAPKSKTSNLGQLGAANMAQTFKSMFREAPRWRELNNIQHEALDLIATEISHICVDGPDFLHGWWQRISDHAAMAQETE